MQTSLRRKHRDRVVRRGLALIIESDFYATDAGRQHFADQLTSIRYCVQEVSIPVATFAPSHHSAPPTLTRASLATRTDLQLRRALRVRFRNLNRDNTGFGKRGCALPLCAVCAGTSRRPTTTSVTIGQRTCARAPAPASNRVGCALTTECRLTRTLARSQEAQHPHRDEPRDHALRHRAEGAARLRQGGRGAPRRGSNHDYGPTHMSLS
jgi:hypothetical protein